MNNFVQIPKLGRVYVHTYPQANVVKFDYAVMMEDKNFEYGSIDELKLKKFSSLERSDVKSKLSDFFSEWDLPLDYVEQVLELMDSIIASYS